MANDLTMDFGFSGNGGEYRGTGWSEPENFGTWMLGQQSLLVLTRPEASGDYRIEFDMGVLTGPGHPSQRFAVSVNGTTVGDFVLSDDGREHCMLPWSVIGREPGLTLVLSHPDAWRPSELSGGEGDQREMSFFLRSARLSLHAAAPMAAPRPAAPVPAAPAAATTAPAAAAAAPARPVAAAPMPAAPAPAALKPVAVAPAAPKPMAPTPAPVAATGPAPASAAPKAAPMPAAPRAAPTPAAPVMAAPEPSTPAPPTAPGPKPPVAQPPTRVPAPATPPMPAAPPRPAVRVAPPEAQPAAPAPEARVPWWKKLLG